MKKRKVFLLALLLSAVFAQAGTTTLTGTLKDSFGTGINGQLLMYLPVPAQDPSTGTAIAPIPVSFRLVNGAILGGASLFDVNTINPSGLYYIARAYDTTGTLVFYGNYIVTGASFNLGAAIPTTVTTSNISYQGIGFLGLTNVWTGPNTFTGINTSCQLNSVLYVGGAITCWAGSDIGAQINTAYAALPAAGGKIVILPQTGGGCYSYSTAMSFTTNLKTIALEGYGPATCLQFTPTSGTAISLNWGGSHQGAPFMRNLSFFGSGAANTAVGIQIGGVSSNGVTDDMAMDHVYSGSAASSNGWGTFISIPASANGAFDVSLDHMGILNNNVGISTTALILRISNSQIVQNVTSGISVAGAQVELFGNDIEPCISGSNNEVGVSMSGSTPAVFAYGNHWEATTACTGQQFVSSTATNAMLGIYGGDFLYDQTSSSQTQMMTWKGDTLVLDGVRVNTAGLAVTEVVNFTGTFGHAWLKLKNTTSNISNAYGGSAMPVFNASLDQSNTWPAAQLSTGSGSSVFAVSPTLTTPTLTSPTLTLLTNGTGLQVFNTTTTCTTAGSVGATCTTGAISLPVAEADTSYRVVCTGKGVTNVPVVIATTNSSASQFTISIAALTAAAASFTSYDCVAGHN